MRPLGLLQQSFHHRAQSDIRSRLDGRVQTLHGTSECLGDLSVPVSVQRHEVDDVHAGAPACLRILLHERDQELQHRSLLLADVSDHAFHAGSVVDLRDQEVLKRLPKLREGCCIGPVAPRHVYHSGNSSDQFVDHLLHGGPLLHLRVGVAGG